MVKKYNLLFVFGCEKCRVRSTYPRGEGVGDRRFRSVNGRCRSTVFVSGAGTRCPSRDNGRIVNSRLPLLRPSSRMFTIIRTRICIYACTRLFPSSSGSPRPPLMDVLRPLWRAQRQTRVYKNVFFFLCASCGPRPHTGAPIVIYYYIFFTIIAFNLFFFLSSPRAFAVFISVCIEVRVYQRSQKSKK